MKNFALIKCFILLSTLVVIAPVYATDLGQSNRDPNFRVSQLPGVARRIPGLRVEEVPISIKSTEKDGKFNNIARFQGRMDIAKGGNLIYTINGDLHVTKIGENEGNFVISVPMNDPKIVVRLRAIDDYGSVYDDGILLESDLYEEVKKKKVNVDAGMGISYLNYLEKLGSTSFKVTEIGLTPKIGASYVLSPKWEVGANGFFTALPLALDKQPAGLSDARWLGINLRFGYKLPFETKRASYYLMSGWYIWGMMLPAAPRLLTYGVSYLGGGQFFLMGRYRTMKNRFYYNYAKFATTQDGGLFSLTNREIAAGFGYQLSKPIPNKRRWMGTIDIAHAQFSNTRQSFRLISATMGVSTSF